MKATLAILFALVAAAAAAHPHVHVDADSFDARDIRIELDAAAERLREAAREMESDLGTWLSAGESDADGAYLGILISSEDDGEGVRVGAVLPGHGAGRAGIKADDVIVSVNGVSLADAEHPGRTLRETLGDVEPGDAVQLVVRRGDDTRELEVETSAGIGVHLSHILPRAFRFADRVIGTHSRHWLREQLELVDIGADLGHYFGIDAGVLVIDAPPKSALKPGDIVRRIAGDDVSSSEDAYRLLGSRAAASEDGDTVSVQVWRRKRDVTADVAVPKPNRYSIDRRRSLSAPPAPSAP